MSGATIKQIRHFIKNNPEHFPDPNRREAIYSELDNLACTSGYVDHLGLMAIFSSSITQEIEDFYENDC